MSGVNVLQRDDRRDQLTSVLPAFFAGPGRPDCPIECGPGWAMVLDRLCVRIAATLADRESFRFERIRSFRGALLVGERGGGPRRDRSRRGAQHVRLRTLRRPRPALSG
ncbi:hypothetical protein Rpal_1118 [Rhodopseudomonas palustris TIE-1]|nr:hypothetical protein Rpal_1118 [Rhodopseudomonas palustris TIE-1]